jgi:uncharacterized protein (DUF58 family)
MTPPRRAFGAVPRGGRAQWRGKASSTSALAWNPVALLRARFERWWQARLPPADSVTLTQRNVYILPTRAGWMLGLTLLVLLLASINYQLNLGYLLTFLLAGCALVAMHVGHANLRGITMTLIAPSPTFAGAKAIFDIKLLNHHRRQRPALALAIHGTHQWVHTDLAPLSHTLVQLAWQPGQRGMHPLPTLSTQTLFPLGTFRVWTLWRPAAELLVYPQPETQAPPLPDEPSDARQGLTHTAPHHYGESDSLRPYRRGDPLKNILWKQVAKTGQLVSRDSVAAQQHDLLLSRAQTHLTHPEQQLNRLCAWVLRADQLGLRYGLRLGGQDIAPEHGPLHLQRCLRALALA